MANEIRPGRLDSTFFRSGKGKTLKLILFVMPFLLLLLILAAFVLPSRLKGDSKRSVVAPVMTENKGFVGKSNVLLNTLLNEEDANVVVRSVETLNKRYPAFEFMLPYDEAEGSNVSDVRLVGINPEYIKNNELRDFYYNSSIPSLLKKQRANLSERYFSIDFKTDKNRRVRIERVFLKPDMFKVALEKDLWKGTVTSAGNSLFDGKKCLYLVHKEMVMPIAHVAGMRNLNMSTTVFDLQGGAFYDSGARKFDYYSYYKDAFAKQPKHLRVEVRKTRKDKSIGWLDLAFKLEDGHKRVLQIVPNKDLLCRVTAPSTEIVTIMPSEYANSAGSTIEYKEGMKILIYDRAGTKLTEFSVLSENPMRLLSAMTYSDEGYSRYYASSKNADVLTRQMVRGVCRNMSNAIGVDTVKLSVDPLLALEFENEMRRYIKTLKESGGFKHMPHEQFEMSMTVMDMATGQILASPSVSDRKDPDGVYAMATRNSSLIRRPIGSTFKPLLSLACVLSNPSLQDLVNTPAKSRITGEEQGQFLGHQTKSWVVGHWGNNRNMTQYLGHSDDVYPVLLASLCLSGKSDVDNLSSLNTLPLGGNSFFQNGLLLGNQSRDMTDYELVKILSALYSVHSFNESDMDKENNLNFYLWEKLFSGKKYMDDFDSCFGLDEVSPDATNMRYDRFRGQPMRGHLVPWVLGQGDNDWSCVKMAEAWTRMLTKRKVEASFIASDAEDEVPNLVDVVAEYKKEAGSKMTVADVNKTWNRYLDSFKQAQSIAGGTLYNMNRAVASLNTSVGRTSDGLVVLSKTGTPDEYRRMETKQLAGNNRYYDVAQFVFSLMPESSFNALKNQRDVKGITCVVRITRSYDNKASDNGMWSSNARDFFSNDSKRLEKLYYMTQKYY